jgi:hypothetical protein
MKDQRIGYVENLSRFYPRLDTREPVDKVFPVAPSDRPNVICERRNNDHYILLGMAMVIIITSTVGVVYLFRHPAYLYCESLKHIKWLFITSGQMSGTGSKIFRIVVAVA